uniref:Transposase Tc1-like domain-containing protein n=1 Tax=Leptobrachium leishanense TaxID=445787 RepID=A0A8C5LPV8_9ANUR
QCAIGMRATGGRHIRLSHLWNRYRTATPATARVLPGTHNTSINAQIGLRACRPHQSLLTLTRRMQWCKARRHWTLEQWRRLQRVDRCHIEPYGLGMGCHLNSYASQGR